MRIVLLAKSSSSPEPYEVTFEVMGGLMTVRCSCKAGAQFQQCKHKRTLISGNVGALFDATQTSLLFQVLTTAEGSELAEQMRTEETALEEVEKQKQAFMTLEKSIKKRMSDLMARGRY